jgi:sigma-B regulation protein RsbU (phosphoserine phosphatase)
VAGFAGLRQKPWRVFVVEPEEQFAALTASLFRQQVLIGVVVAALAVAWALWRARSVVRPVLALTAAADRVAAGDLTARAPQYANDEVGRLAASFNEMVPQLQERAQLQHALAVATEVQQALLPEKDPIHPRLDVAGYSRYCDETGGDYYDFLDVNGPGGKALLIAVGDVTGHGIASALLMAAARGAVRAHADRAGELAHVMSRVNRVLSEDSRHNRFMTLGLFVVDPAAGVLRWASAGHDPPFLYRAGPAQFEELRESNLMLGIDSDTVYREFERSGLQPNDLIFVGTDGIWEMHNAAGEQFGKARLREVLQAHHNDSAAVIAHACEQALAAYRGSVAPQDDVTFVVVKMK